MATVSYRYSISGRCSTNAAAAAARREETTSMADATYAKGTTIGGSEPSARRVEASREAASATGAPREPSRYARLKMVHSACCR
eukprot:scaffold978_cov118-Isochrysis_galbana.AAC.9